MYKSVEEFLEKIPEENRKASKALRTFIVKNCAEAPGSRHNHQAWPGGYIGHVSDIMNYASFLYTQMTTLRPLPFVLEDALLVLFLHDIEKPVKYTPWQSEAHADKSNYEIRDELIEKYWFVLNDDHKNALQYIHGEGEDYSGSERAAGPLAAFCHCCDVISARIYFDYPRTLNY